jgi:predicted tellurium resistance membrane protein TerC
LARSCSPISSFSGDNAVLIGLAAAGLPAAQRSRAILFGMIFATVLRVIFSIFAVYLLEVPGLMLIGGLLLLWIAYGFFTELREEKAVEEDPEGHEDGIGGKTMASALKQTSPGCSRGSAGLPMPVWR